ncbi:unnamed protein product [Rotaria socialis]|uniref:Uncharacterized protein n=1 Tax=Rotaria socialis TaxID=392032 RepID=A0A820T1Q8_9BILA|nr:unnamed protein product [Rotaria socialis]CAF4459983.1 unnamed protein product [Rotaria socialis]CAF4525604.1 unnamed protein product [Rotaria socialis]CAF4871477.1 unnamed protein product [Rotaria socialis]
MEFKAAVCVKVEETQTMKDNTQRDFNQVPPAVEKANKAIGRLKAKEYTIEVVIKTVCIRICCKRKPSTKILLGDPI